MSAASRCIKLLLLVTLLPLALRAGSLLIGGGHAAPASSWHGGRSGGAATAAATATGRAGVVSAAGSVRGRAYRPTRCYRRRGRSESALVASDGARRLRQAGGGWFEDDKRLAPTGSNPLHNLR